MLRQLKHRPLGMRFYQLHSSIKLALITYINTYDATKNFQEDLKQHRILKNQPYYDI